MKQRFVIYARQGILLMKLVQRFVRNARKGNRLLKGQVGVLHAHLESFPIQKQYNVKHVYKASIATLARKNVNFAQKESGQNKILFLTLL